MPQAVIPFQADPKAFFISIFVIMILLQLLFRIFGVFVYWWERINVSNEKAFHRPAFERVMNFLLMRKVDPSKDIERDIIAS
jgi:hypothetical protein